MVKNFIVKGLVKRLKNILSFLLLAANFILAKAVRATIIYAPAENFERECGKANIFFDLLREYFVLTVAVVILAILGLLRIVRGLLSGKTGKKNAPTKDHSVKKSR